MDNNNYFVEMLKEEIEKSNINNFVKRLLINMLEDSKTVDKKRDYVSEFVENMKKGGN